MVDDTAWHSLQIFNVDIHPSTLKQGGNISSSKEGFSIFSLLNHCITPQGVKALRLMLLRPSRNISELQRRHDVIQHVMDLKNLDFTKAARECFKCVKSIPVRVGFFVKFKVFKTIWSDVSTLNLSQFF